MQVLGIDYGGRKIGVALSLGPLAEPYKVIRFNSQKEAIGKLVQIAKQQNVDLVVVGISEGKTGKESKAVSYTHLTLPTTPYV